MDRDGPDLLARFREGDRETWELLFNRVADEVRREFAWCGDLREDILNEGMLLGFRKRHKPEHAKNLHGWLWTVTSRNAPEVLRKNRPLTQVAREPDGKGEPDGKDGWPGFWDDFEGARRKMPLELRAVFDDWCDGRSVPESAGSLGVAQHTVRSRLEKAFDFMRRHLRDYDGREPEE